MTDENIIVIYKDMPDGLENYPIVLNSCLSFEQKRISTQHEIEHIERGDYDDIQNVDILEYYRHNIKNLS
ncbi:hypothetical protein [Anaerostipes sp.]|uniref:hypothetical protein n=2 Tax=Anaerostipes TaxID=207244 RepID=UPI0025900160|nr:hypothetical protein [Anaerostipes sp.]MCI5623591.1 hypothetical protein [Anaerostipes sp.]